MRKGISPLIASVLLLAFTISIAGIAGPWLTNLVEDTQESTTDDTEKLSSASTAQIDIPQTQYNEETNNLTVTMQNKGDAELENFTATVQGSEPIQKQINEKLGTGEIHTFKIETESPETLQIDSETLPVQAKEDLETENDGTTGTDGPTAVASVNTSQVETGEAIEFDGSGSSEGDSSIENYSWDFDDGETDTGQTVTHGYSSSGNYTAELTVEDQNDNTDADSIEIEVEATAPDNVVSHWKFDEGSGSTAVDSEGSNDGTINGATYTTDAERGTVLSFDGSNDYIDVGDNSELANQKPMSHAVWIKPSDLSSRQKIFHKQDSGGSGLGSMMTIESDGSVRYWIGDGSDWHRATSSKTLSADSWNFVAGTFGDNNGVRIYVGTDIEGSNSYTGNVNSNSVPFQIAARNAAGKDQQYVDGMLSDFFRYNSELSEKEVERLYNSTS